MVFGCLWIYFEAYTKNWCITIDSCGITCWTSCGPWLHMLHVLLKESLLMSSLLFQHQQCLCCHFQWWEPAVSVHNTYHFLLGWCDIRSTIPTCMPWLHLSTPGNPLDGISQWKNILTILCNTISGTMLNTRIWIVICMANPRSVQDLSLSSSCFAEGIHFLQMQIFISSLLLKDAVVIR